MLTASLNLFKLKFLESTLNIMPNILSHIRLNRREENYLLNKQILKFRFLQINDDFQVMFQNFQPLFSDIL